MTPAEAERIGLIPPRWHADGCYVCNHCGSRRAPWQGGDAARHHNRDCRYGLAIAALEAAPKVSP